jgi:hypothetical protein
MKLVGAIVAALLAAGTVAAAENAPVVNVASIANLRAGTSLDAALNVLNAQGLRIVFSSAVVRPDMKLATAPRATEPGALLAEILAPFNLRAVRDADGSWLVVAGSAVQKTAVDETAPIETIDVTASRFGLASSGGSGLYFDREAVESMPHLGDDALRMLKVMPGVTGGDFSAALNVRGGRRDETYLSIDGAEIHNAFHFRELDGAASVLDTTLVQGIDFITGGITSEYGDYMSGIVNLETRRPRPDDEYHHALGVSFVSAYGRTSGTFADGRGSWLTALRRGFLDVLMKQVTEDDETLSPRFTDLFSALDYDFSDRTSLAARLLVSDDDLILVTSDDDDNEAADSAGWGQSAHLWLTLDHDWSDELRMRTMLAAARARHHRDSEGQDDKRYGYVYSDNEFDYLDFKQDWTLRLADRHLVGFGARFMSETADYDYTISGAITDPFVSPAPIPVEYSTVGEFKGSRVGVYGSWRTRFDGGLTTEVGGRWDSYRYPQGLAFDVASPRLNLVYSMTDQDDLRAAWGVIHQPQGIDDLQVEDNIETYFRPERAQQASLGYTRRLPYELTARVDVYYKEYSHLRPRFENALDVVQLIPEVSVDRVRINASEAKAHGIELTLRRETDRGFGGWVSLAVGEARDVEDDREVPRLWEQEQTLSFNGSYKGQKWRVNLAGLFHSGTPTTRIGARINALPDGSYSVQPQVGPRNGARLGSYSRIDLRASRDVELESGKLSFYLEVTNLLGTKNPCCVEDYGIETAPGGWPRYHSEESYWLPMMPSAGFQWEF